MGQVMEMGVYRKRRREMDLRGLTSKLQLRSPEIEDCISELVIHGDIPLRMFVYGQELPARQEVYLGCNYPDEAIAAVCDQIQPWFLGIRIKYHSRAYLETLNLQGTVPETFDETLALIDYETYLQSLVSDPEEDFYSPWVQTAFTFVANLIYVYDSMVIRCWVDERNVFRLKLLIDTHEIDLDIDGPGLQRTHELVNPDEKAVIMNSVA